MAIVEIDNNLTNIQGLSSDPPLGAENGATLHYVDTGEVFVRHEGNWVKDLRMARAINDAEFL
jgi:hypothetical protein